MSARPTPEHRKPAPAILGRFRKAWAALSAGVVVVLASGLVTGSPAVWLSTGISAVGAALAVLAAPANDDPAD